MNRRALLAITGAAAWPLVAPAQQPGRVPIVAFVTPNARSTGAPFAAGFVQRLQDLGWTEARTVSIVYGWGDGRSESTTEIIRELVRREVDVIVTHGVPNIVAAKEATATIPIVFALATDPIGSGLVRSLARPGGNITGLSIQAPDLSAKRLALLREVVPALRRLAVLGDPGSVIEIEEAVAAASALGWQVVGPADRARRAPRHGFRRDRRPGRRALCLRRSS